MAIFLATLFVIICCLLIVVVLLQKGRGGGLSAAFGGTSSSAFGTKTGDFFTWVTIVLTGMFLLMAVVTTLYFRTPPVVNAPVVQPDPGKPISKPTQVTFAAAAKRTEVYYTINGATPTKDNTKDCTKYTGAFEVKPGDIVRAIAIKSGHPSEVTVARYTLEEIEPVPTPAPSTTSAPAESTSKPAPTTAAAPVPG